MSKYRIIGNMTGNSMDAVDLVLTEFDGDVMTDICSFTKPYTKDMQERIEGLQFTMIISGRLPNVLTRCVSKTGLIKYQLMQSVSTVRH